MGNPCRRLDSGPSWPRLARRGPNRGAMRMRGLEPPRGFPHTDLNRARLPIPPHPRARANSSPASNVVRDDHPRGRSRALPERSPGDARQHTHMKEGAHGEPWVHPCKTRTMARTVRALLLSFAVCAFVYPVTSASAGAGAHAGRRNPRRAGARERDRRKPRAHRRREGRRLDLDSPTSRGYLRELARAR